MKNPENRNRISKIGKKYGKENWKKNLIIDGRFLKHRFHSKETIEKINTMYKNGKTPTEISKILNISRSSIYNHIIVKSLKN